VRERQEVQEVPRYLAARNPARNHAKSGPAPPGHDDFAWIRR
jgi:hypothetical protein